MLHPLYKQRQVLKALAKNKVFYFSKIALSAGTTCKNVCLNATSQCREMSFSLSEFH